jgi:integrase
MLGGFAMARSPKPWYWKARRSWFVTISGQRHDLGPTKADALVRFHGLMADPPKRAHVARGQLILSVIESFLDWCEKNRAPDTYAWYRDRLERFARKYPTLTTSEIRPYHVQEWIDGLEGVTSGTKRNYCRTIKRAMRWAKRLGYIDHNPIDDMEQPKAGKRELVLSQEEFDGVLARVSDRCFRDLLITTWETGCRPQESLRVEARHVDLDHNRWVFPASESKGGIPRIVYLTDRAAEITRRLALRHLDGKLFRNSAGNAWSTEAVNCAFTWLQTKMGAEAVKKHDTIVSERDIKAFAKTLAPTRTVRGKTVKKSEHDKYLEARTKLRYRLARRYARKYSLYALRHSWATHALERGMDSVTVAVLMGHRDPSTLARVYQHLTHNPVYLREQAKRAVS